MALGTLRSDPMSMSPDGRRVMSIKIDSEKNVDKAMAQAMTITGGWLIGWSGILLALALV